MGQGAEHGRLHFRPEDEGKANNRIDPTHTSTPLMCPPPKPAADGAATETAAVVATHLPGPQFPPGTGLGNGSRHGRNRPQECCLEVSSESCACWLGKGFSADDLISSGQVSVELLHDGRALYFLYAELGRQTHGRCCH